MARFHIGHAALGSSRNMAQRVTNRFQIEAGNKYFVWVGVPGSSIAVRRMNGSAGAGSESIPHI